MKVIDISQPLGRATAPWPGDAPFRQAWTMLRERGDSVNVAEVSLSVHLGTHADGPAHVADGAPAIGALDLDAYLGRAVVVDARGHGPLLGPDLLDGLDLARSPRVLLRTRDAVDPESFPPEFPALSSALALRLAEEGVLLVGTDAPSVDPAESRELEAHRILGEGGVAILENLVLTGVEAGTYTLLALPLKLLDADSSPVRAVLLEGRL